MMTWKGLIMKYHRNEIEISTKTEANKLSRRLLRVFFG